MEKVLTIGSKLGKTCYLTIKGEPWFVAKDVCDILQLTDVSKSVERLDDDEKLIRKIFVSGQSRDVILVNESGLYNLIFRSNKPEAKVFRKWVTGEVLPSIRRYGYYIDPKSELSRKERNVMLKSYYRELERNLTAEDIYKCSKRFRCTELDVQFVMQGIDNNNEIMRDLQERAVANRENHIDAYSDARVREVLDQLK